MLRGDFLKDYHPIQGERGGGVIILLVVSRYRNRDRLQLAGWVGGSLGARDSKIYITHYIRLQIIRSGLDHCVVFFGKTLYSHGATQGCK